MSKKKTHVEFTKEVYELVGDEYEVLSEYVKTHTKVKLRHTECEHEYEVTPASFLTGRRCPKCAGRIKRSTEDYKNILYELVKNEYELIGEYKNSSTHVTLKHVICNNTFDVLPSNFYKGKRCGYCYGNKKKTTEEFKQEVINLVGNEYEISSEYINTDTKINLKHNICGRDYYVKPYHFLQGSRCPFCNESKGEKKISQWLNDNEIKYKSQYKFEDCKNINELKFDFAIFDSEKRLICVIEYDGEQHFKPVDFAGKGEDWAMASFEKNKKRDEIKNTYCITNSIPLLRIPYWRFDDIEEILSQYLTKGVSDSEQTG
ncbi:hypothetical protein BAOM_3146 [Peribacillus asahii]|uniref:DUF2726 domain-containing protein n=1 Tax=Peribacillus asahii TaxID=228899 RepID=A0A3Q9RNR8_9BACI|nr:DUF2726 domain-containing protein [Peribacillus asahii]AZV43755.1 hypothetical protein BAOM_3146 [Peribacillus asahii]